MRLRRGRRRYPSAVTPPRTDPDRFASDSGRWAILDLSIHAPTARRSVAVMTGQQRLGTTDLQAGEQALSLVVDRSRMVTDPVLDAGAGTIARWSLRSSAQVRTPTGAVSVPGLRPTEEPDVVADRTTLGEGPVVLLTSGWAPREMVDGGAVRWLGDGADLVIIGAPASRLRVRGRAGACLGTGARAQLWHRGAVIDDRVLDATVGQRIDLQFDLSSLAQTNPLEVTIRVVRPRPVFTAHDNRVLNILVSEVTAKGRRGLG